MTTSAQHKDHLGDESLSENASSTAKNIAAAAKDATKSAKASVETGIDQAHDALDRASSRAQLEARRAGDQATLFVRENPGIAIAGAVGLGVLIGLALRQRDY